MTDMYDGCLGEDTPRYRKIANEANKLIEEIFRMPFRDKDSKTLFGNVAPGDFMEKGRLLLEKYAQLNEIRHKYCIPKIGGSFADSFTNLMEKNERTLEVFG